MESVSLVLGALVVIGGAAWTGAKAAFFTTLFIRALFGKATQPEKETETVFVPVFIDRGHGYPAEDIIDVTPSETFGGRRSR